MLGEDVSSFTTYNDSVELWIDDHPGGRLDSLYYKTVGPNAKPYTTVYCEVVAKKLLRETTAYFPSEYDSLHEVSKVVRVKALMPELNCGKK